MNLQETKNGLTYLSFPETLLCEVVHGFFTRKGGVSPIPYASLNLSISTGDSREHIRQNRDLIFDAMERPNGSMFDVWQVHSDNVICSDKPRNIEEQPVKADAIFTQNPQVTLLMRFADCVPIFLYDPMRKAIGIVHAGWQGTIARIGREAVEAMGCQYGSNPADIHAGIGPSIGPDHYEIGEDVAKKVKTTFGADANFLLRQVDGKVLFDLWAANLLVLQQVGLKHIQVSNVCTACNLHDWYSHRGEGGKTGRFGAVLSLKSS